MDNTNQEENPQAPSTPQQTPQPNVPPPATNPSVTQTSQQVQQAPSAQPQQTSSPVGGPGGQKGMKLPFMIVVGVLVLIVLALAGYFALNQFTGGNREEVPAPTTFEVPRETEESQAP